jgi:anti-sigma factor RsiW
MSVGSSSRSCDRARAWISFQLDGELAEVERAMLQRHLGQCPGCTSYAAETRAFTEALREAPAVQFTASAVVPTRRNRAPQFRRVLPGAAAAMAMLTVGGTLGHVLTTRKPPEPGPIITIFEPLRDRSLTSDRIVLPIGQRNASEDF